MQRTRTSVRDEALMAAVVIRRAHTLAAAAYSPMVRTLDARMIAAALDETLVALDVCAALERRARGAARRSVSETCASLSAWADKLEMDLSRCPSLAFGVVS